MDDLSTKECDHLLAIWGICFRCETTIEENEGGITYECGCLSHSDCPVLRLRENHSTSCSLKFKREIVQRYVEKSFHTDNVIKAYQKYMKANFGNLLGEAPYTSPRLTWEELGHLMFVWRICYKCETSIGSTNPRNHGEGVIDRCQCLSHSLNCYPCVRTAHKSKNCRLKRNNVQEAYQKYMKDKCPNLVEKYPDSLVQPGAKVVKLQKEMENNLKKLKKVEQTNGQLNKQNTDLVNEIRKLKLTNEQENLRTAKLEREKAVLVREMATSRKQLDQTSGKLKKLSEEVKEVKIKWLKVREESAGCKKEQMEDTEPDSSDEFILNCEWDNFKLHFSNLQEKTSSLSRECYSTRNSEVIVAITRKMVPFTELLASVKEDVVTILKTGATEMKCALNDLNAVEYQLPTTSSNRKNKDVKFLD